MTWIIFKIKDKKVDQMSSGAGVHRVVAFRSCLAFQHGVTVAEVHLELEDQHTCIQKPAGSIQNQNSVVSYEMVRNLKGEMTRNVFKN